MRGRWVTRKLAGAYTTTFQDGGQRSGSRFRFWQDPSWFFKVRLFLHLNITLCCFLGKSDGFPGIFQAFLGTLRAHWLLRCYWEIFFAHWYKILVFRCSVHYVIVCFLIIETFGQFSSFAVLHFLLHLRVILFILRAIFWKKIHIFYVQALA